MLLRFIANLRLQPIPLLWSFMISMRWWLFGPDPWLTRYADEILTPTLFRFYEREVLIVIGVLIRLWIWCSLNSFSEWSLTSQVNLSKVPCRFVTGTDTYRYQMAYNRTQLFPPLGKKFVWEYRLLLATKSGSHDAARSFIPSNERVRVLKSGSRMPWTE